MARLSHFLVVAALVAACSPAPKAPEAPPPAAAPAGPQPNATLQATFPDCPWGEVRAAGVSIWAFNCPTNHLVADEALPGFQLERDGHKTPVIQIFSKAADAPIDAVLDAVRKASPGPATASCTLQASPDMPDHVQFLPTGASKTAHDKFVAGKSDGPSMPCGALGPSEAGMRMFRIVSGAPDKVVVIDTGSDPQVYDPETIAASK